MSLADSQKEDITINRTAKWELSSQTYKLSCDSSWGLTSAWEIKYPGSRCSYNQWCYFLYFKLPLAVGAAFKNKVCHLSNLTWTKLCRTLPQIKIRKKGELLHFIYHENYRGDCWRVVFVQNVEKCKCETLCFRLDVRLKYKVWTADISTHQQVEPLRGLWMWVLQRQDARRNVKGKRIRSQCKLSGEPTPQHVFIPCCSEQADGFQWNSTIFPCSRGLKTTGSQCLLI